MTEPQKPVQRVWEWQGGTQEERDLLNDLLTDEEADRLMKKLMKLMFDGNPPVYLLPTRTVELSEEMKDLL